MSEETKPPAERASGPLAEGMLLGDAPEAAEQLGASRPPRIRVLGQGAGQFEVLGRVFDTFYCVLVSVKDIRRYYESKSDKMPVCFSNDLLAPDPSSEDPQSKTCRGCARAKFKRARDVEVGESRAPDCSRRFAVVLLPIKEKEDGFGAAIPCLLGVSPTNRAALSDYCTNLTLDNKGFTTVVTKVSAKSAKSGDYDVTALEFEMARAATPEEHEAAQAYRKMAVDFAPTEDDVEEPSETEEAGSEIPID